MIWRPFYFARLVVDPKNPERLFKTDRALIVSDDGGKSFTDSAASATHGDWHDLWMDPTNPKHIVGGDDGGLCISFDGGNRWWKSNNLPVSQFYHVAIEGDEEPAVVAADRCAWCSAGRSRGRASRRARRRRRRMKLLPPSSLTIEAGPA